MGGPRHQRERRRSPDASDNIAAECGTATPPRPRRRSPAPRTSVARRRQPAPRTGADGAALDPRPLRRGERPDRSAHQQSDARPPWRRHGGTLPDLALPQVRPGWRCRRRLRHEDRRDPEDLSSPTRRGRRSARCHWQAERSEEFLSAYRTAATSPAMPSSRSMPTAGCWRCASSRSPTSAPTPRRPAWRSSC